jgi:hypothetical protein
MPEDMGKGNPDAVQDEGLIRSVMARDLGPILEAVGARLRDLEEDLGELKDLQFKFIQGLIGAADGHKRTRLGDELSSKYGQEFEPFEGFYKDTMGKGFKDSILEDLMGEGAPDEGGRDEWIKGKLGEAKGKYGKYVGLSMEEPAAGPAEGLEAAQAEESAGQGIEDMGEEKEAEGEAEEGDAISGLMKQLASVGGEKRKLSSAKK